MNVA
ncbi:hypothetical protein Bhyg_08678 [Pseudolycoriella hygida]|jgi:hypothetical protein